MIGKTNAQTSAGGGIKGEKVNIFLKTNQSSHEDLKGAIITVSYATVVEEYIWSGNGITVEIPPYINYSVYVSSVEGYASPASFSSTSVPENSKSVELEYKTEIVSVTLSADDGSSVYGASVTINGKSYTWDGNAIIQKVAFGVSYNVSAGALSGFGQPSSQSFTAGQALREVSFVYIKSTLVVNILSNQSEDSEIGSIKATVSYGSTSVQVSSGEKINIPVGSQTITITFPYRNGWKKPSTIRFSNTSGGEVVKSGTYQTEIVYVSTYSDEGGITGFTTTVKKVDGTVLGTSSASMLICTVPSGTQYIVSCSDVDGYIKPAEQIFTASSATDARRNVSMGYIKHDGTKNPTNGVWIQDTDGYCHTTDAWTGKYTANGIAIVTDNCRFVMALTNAHTSACQWGSNGTTVSDITTTTKENGAKADYYGESNTTTILNQLGNSSSTDDAPAAYYCRVFKFPNGKNGYLGASGEWQAALDNKSAIVSALSKCGGSSMKSYYWSSTQYSSNYCWFAHWEYAELRTYSKDSDRYVRAFSTI